MAYADTTDVEGEFKNVRFTETSLVTAATVTEFIEETDLLIDSYLSRRYVVPLTAENSLKLARMWCRQIVAARVGPMLGMISNSEKTNNPKNETPAGYVIKHLEKIAMAKADLPPDATFKTQSTTLKFHAEVGCENIFDPEKQQW